ncbi:hypothetical protein BDR07DRAFT_1475768 [Suillus spraguei]|nr:hypothetical protein BDR07DRAFT_1475768 [Suillus spraguei]
MLFYLSLLAVLASLSVTAIVHLFLRELRLSSQALTTTRRLPFSDQARAGLSSPMFDIDGLDEQGTQEVLDIMRAQRVNFDQARLIRHNQILARNGIDPSGMPLDSKAVTRL